MKKVTSLLVAAFTTAIFAGSAMAATPVQQAPAKVTTHQKQQHKPVHAATHKATVHKKAAKTETGTTAATTGTPTPAAK
ncbi:hypothetical protein [Acinetobacter sp. WZC-1]|uniref:hypothetical protein n=1 Tax=Acinetobacter sp. WZC-1 TaxID=3459034 RepID=UPI00403D86FC